ncbi:MAG: ABC transporter substrate-binding protein [Proteobacteria bacterium]|nr:ABC transporter substrate-binding protein [Pseudomonadota bacterium]
MKRTALLLGLVFALVAILTAPAMAAKVIKWGVLIDLSGPTSDWGKQQAMGQQDAAAWINKTGGINGKKLQLIVIDDGYKISRGVAGYNRLVTGEKVLGVYIQSTGTTMALRKKIIADGVATFGASFTAKMQNPKRTPFSFFVGPSYSAMGRIALVWIKKNWKAKRPPKVAYLYPDNKYGRDILNTCKAFAKGLGIKVVSDQVINWPTTSATTQLVNMRRDNPDFAYLTTTAMNGAVILKDARKLRIKTKIISNIRNFEESLIRLSGGAAEGSYGTQPFAPYGAAVPGMKKIVAWVKKHRSGFQGSAVYVEGWVNILVIAEALKRADKAGQLTPAGVRAQFEKLKNFSTGGLAQLITYTKTDHRASMCCPVYVVKGGKMVPTGPAICLKRSDMRYFGK